MKRVFDSLLLLSLFVLLVFAVTSTALAAGHGGQGDHEPMAQATLFSVDSLLLHDGQNGRPAYVAYQGRVYDVSEAWSGGTHYGNQAGQDMGGPLGVAPHGDAVVAQLSQVGFLALNLWTAEELAIYNSQDGNPPYIAVDGIVYDVSETWPSGSHRGYPAGTDITEPIEGAPHGQAVLDKLPVVGAIIANALTVQELAIFDGQDKNPGYIAVNGVIYDVSDTWPTGSHRGFSAGSDITEAIAGSAHGMSVLAKLPIVGRLQ